MRSSKPLPRASAIALSLGTSSSRPISVFCKNTLPSPLSERVSGSLSWSRLFACDCGKSIGTPTVKSGAETMKMMSNTSMTSTMGVTLISLMTLRRRRRRDPASAPRPAAPLIPMAYPQSLGGTRPPPRSAALVDLARQNRRKFVGKSLQALGLLVHLGGELIVENRRRYGGHKPDRGRKQGFRNAGGHHGQRGVLRRRDRLEAGHDAPHRPEQAHEGAG